MQNYFQRLEHALTQRNLTKGALAAHLHVALSTISRWQRALPRVETIQRTADFLGVSAQWLMTGEDDNLAKRQIDPDGQTAKSEGKAKDSGGDSKNSRTVEERLEALEADNQRLREEMAGMLETLAGRIRSQGHDTESHNGNAAMGA